MTTSAKPKVLLTGGSGFIGRNLMESSSFQSLEVLAPNRSEVDLQDEEAVRAYLHRNQFNAVIHAAVKPGHRNARDPSHLLLSNLRMFHNLTRNQDLFQTLIILGSGAIYDGRFYGPKRHEDSFGDHVPVDEHGFAKYTIARYIEGRAGIHDLRLFGVYGPHEDYQIRFISNMICKAIAGLPLTMKQDRRFDYVCVDDLAPILVRAATEGVPWNSVNITPDSSALLSQIATIVLEVVGRTDLPLVIKEPGEGLEYSGDNSRLKKWIPDLRLTSLREGIGRLATWYLSNWSSVDQSRLAVDP